MPGGATPAENITLATIRSDSLENAQSLDQLITSVFGARFGGAANVEPVADATMYIALVSSTQVKGNHTHIHTLIDLYSPYYVPLVGALSRSHLSSYVIAVVLQPQELPDLERLRELQPDVPIIFFNLGLDLLRGDLGLPLFPGRELHHRFLSGIKPVYYLKSRSFATSLRRPPFIINYTGVLFRAYPGPYKSFLDTGNAQKKLTATTQERPSNKDFRDSLTQSLVVKGVPSEELQTKGELVWWEKDLDLNKNRDWMI